MVAGLNAIPGVTCLTAQGGFYLFPGFSAIEKALGRIEKELTVSE